jgi:hypothetical protein
MTRRWTMAVLVLLLGCPPARAGIPRFGFPPGSSPPESTEYRFPTPRERLKDWTLNTFGPTAPAGSATSAAWDGALSGLYAVLMNAGWNLAHEFVLGAPRW